MGVVDRLLSRGISNRLFNAIVKNPVVQNNVIEVLRLAVGDRGSRFGKDALKRLSDLGEMLVEDRRARMSAPTPPFTPRSLEPERLDLFSARLIRAGADPVEIKRTFDKIKATKLEDITPSVQRGMMLLEKHDFKSTTPAAIKRSLASVRNAFLFTAFAGTVAAIARSFPDVAVGLSGAGAGAIGGASVGASIGGAIAGKPGAELGAKLGAAVGATVVGAKKFIEAKKFKERPLEPEEADVRVKAGLATRFQRDQAGKAKGTLKPKFIVPAANVIQASAEEVNADELEFDMFNYVPPTSEGDGYSIKESSIKAQAYANQQMLLDGGGIDMYPMWGQLEQPGFQPPFKEKAVDLPPILFNLGAFEPSEHSWNPSLLITDMYRHGTDVNGLNEDINESMLYGMVY